MSAQRPGAVEHRINSASSSLFWEAQRHLVSFLQWRFSKCRPGSYHLAFNPDGSIADESEIFIGGDTPINPSKVGSRPAITVTRGGASFAGMSLNDTSSFDMRSGTKTRLDLVPVTMVVNFLGRTAAEAEAISSYGVRQCWALRDVVVVSSNVFHAFGDRPQVGAPSPAGALVQGSPDSEWVAVGVNFPCFLVEAMTSTPLNKRVLRDVGVEVTTES